MNQKNDDIKLIKKDLEVLKKYLEESDDAKMDTTPIPISTIKNQKDIK